MARRPFGGTPDGGGAGNLAFSAVLRRSPAPSPVRAWRLDIGLSIVLLAASIVGALWLAARIYAAGVLMYGQRPGLRAVPRLVRTGM